MPILRHLHTLTRYSAWANDLLYARLATLPQQELLAPRPIRWGNILRTLNHVYLMDVVWQAHLQGLPHNLTTRNPETAPPFGKLREAQRQIDAWYVGYADTLTAEMGDEVVHFTFIGGGSGAMRREDIVLHAVNHTTYHRGHVAAMLYQISTEPLTTDLPVFLREERG
jgi:uncharacterized damage-inducible protein DinB